MSFDPANYIKKKSAEFSENAHDTVLVAVSGGVDSLTSASLLKHAGVPTKLIFIDNGYQRINEPKTVVEFFRKQGFDIELINAKKRFYEATFKASFLRHFKSQLTFGFIDCL